MTDYNPNSLEATVARIETKLDSLLLQTKSNTERIAVLEVKVYSGLAVVACIPIALQVYNVFVK